jgi:hypothetical protein
MRLYSPMHLHRFPATFVTCQFSESLLSYSRVEGCLRFPISSFPRLFRLFSFSFDYSSCLTPASIVGDSRPIPRSSSIPLYPGTNLARNYRSALAVFANSCCALFAASCHEQADILECTYKPGVLIILRLHAFNFAADP